MKYIEPVLQHYNRTDLRVAVMASVCWRLRYKSIRVPVMYRATLLRRALLATDGKLTALGMCYAQRHGDRFLAMLPEVKVLSEETKSKMAVSRARRRLVANSE